jgi:hypothetical protein
MDRLASRMGPGGRSAPSSRLNAFYGFGDIPLSVCPLTLCPGFSGVRAAGNEILSEDPAAGEFPISP